jgi:hypothetical protein
MKLEISRRHGESDDSRRQSAESRFADGGRGVIQEHAKSGHIRVGKLEHRRLLNDLLKVVQQTQDIAEIFWGA